MPNYRKSRVNESVVRETAEIIRNVKDPRITSAFITITAAEVTSDLKFAKIYFSNIGGDTAEIKKGLISATGFIRHELAEKLNLRITPELKFIHDDSAQNGANISSILKSLDINNYEEH